MKPIWRVLLGLLLISSLLIIASQPLIRSFAQQGESDWGEFLNPDGSINWANLTYLGDTSEPAQWMNVEFPGGIQIPLGEAHYSRYVTPSGNVLVLPSPATMFMTFLHPDESGFTANPPQMLSSGAQILSALTTGFVDLQQVQALGYVDPMAFFQAVIDGQENIWSVVLPTFLIEIAHMSIDSGFLVTGIWLYLSGINCDEIPGGCPISLLLTPTPGGPGGTPTPPPSSGDCPQVRIQTEAITARGEKIAPLHPVVVGQDVERRGADVEVQVTIPPVIFTWYEAVEREVCSYTATGEGSGCPGPANRYDQVLNGAGHETEWSPLMENNRYWLDEIETECIEHTELFPDYLNTAALSVQLNGDSRVWIQTSLAQAYPGAHLIHPDWAFTLYGPGDPGANGTVHFAQILQNLPFADPGVYEMRLNGRTMGTLVSSPRTFTLSLSEFTVELLRVTLIEMP